MSAADDAIRWFQQAATDLEAAKHNAFDYPYVACFMAQQAAEKALKGTQLWHTGLAARSHSLSELNSMLQKFGCSLGEINRHDIRDLELMYTQARYPDMLPDV